MSVDAIREIEALAARWAKAEGARTPYLHAYNAKTPYLHAYNQAVRDCGRALLALATRLREQAIRESKEPTK